MDENLDFEEALEETADSAYLLESLLETCRHFVELAQQSKSSSSEEVHECLEEFSENGYGVFSLHDEEDYAAPLKSDPQAVQLLKLAVERRQEEGYSITPTHTVISTCGHVFIINIDDLSQCTVVRNVD
ncbi:MAG: hypothetical protein ACI9TY_000188 [Alphaproteobacteria bacterium]|jgi:hypothetical protein